MELDICGNQRHSQSMTKRFFQISFTLVLVLCCSTSRADFLDSLIDKTFRIKALFQTDETKDNTQKHRITSSNIFTDSSVKKTQSVPVRPQSISANESVLKMIIAPNGGTVAVIVKNGSGKDIIKIISTVNPNMFKNICSRTGIIDLAFVSPQHIIYLFRTSQNFIRMHLLDVSKNQIADITPIDRITSANLRAKQNSAILHVKTQNESNVIYKIIASPPKAESVTRRNVLFDENANPVEIPFNSSSNVKYILANHMNTYMLRKQPNGGISFVTINRNTMQEQSLSILDAYNFKECKLYYDARQKPLFLKVIGSGNKICTSNDLITHFQNINKKLQNNGWDFLSSTVDGNIWLIQSKGSYFLYDLRNSTTKLLLKQQRQNNNNSNY